MMINYNFLFLINLLVKCIKSILTSSLVRGIFAISLLSAGVFIYSTLFIQLIGSGTGMYSDQFEVNLFLNIKEILLLIWSNFSIVDENFFVMSIILYKNNVIWGFNEDRIRKNKLRNSIRFFSDPASSSSSLNIISKDSKNIIGFTKKNNLI